MATRTLLTDAEIRRLYEAGKSGAAIATLAGVSRHTVYRSLAAQGVVRRQTGAAPRNVDDAGMTELYRTGVSMAEIGRRYHLPRQVIAQRLIAAGVHIVVSRPCARKTANS